MEKLNFIFLHGFLGQAQDWDGVIQNLQKEFPQHHYQALDYFNHPPLSPKVSFEKWSENLVNYLGAEFGNQRLILVGYSLGGRLALHALTYFPEKFSFLFLISTNPGLLESQVEERKKRRDDDQAWSQRFLNEDWEVVVRDWNLQSVFEGSKNEPERQEKQFRRDLLAKALSNWSLGGQEDLRSVLTVNQRKIAWTAGDLDRKYIQLTKDIFKICPDMIYNICPNSSHRVLFDNPVELSRAMGRIIRKDFK